MRGEASNAAERCQRPGALGERWLGDIRWGRAGAGVLPRRHDSMVAKVGRHPDFGTGPAGSGSALRGERERSYAEFLFSSERMQYPESEETSKWAVEPVGSARFRT